MKQTPAHDVFNSDLLAYMPKGCKRIVEVGCSTGALARAYRAINLDCEYIGIEIDSDYAAIASEYCTRTITGDIETMPDETFHELFPCDCFVFGDLLEHLRDPWGFLQRIRSRIQPEGQIVACIPNAQHWSLQVKLCCGAMHYQDSGLLDRTHLRMFTRTTMLDMFQKAGFRVVDGKPRIFAEPIREQFVPAIKLMATTAGVNVDQAIADALPLQYVIVAATA
jgi:2-polyprenyl-3-methyl-5-hydroxy-6-metoxy-1,4-benzoquinol methylase